MILQPWWLQLIFACDIVEAVDQLLRPLGVPSNANVYRLATICLFWLLLIWGRGLPIYPDTFIISGGETQEVGIVGNAKHLRRDPSLTVKENHETCMMMHIEGDLLGALRPQTSLEETRALYNGSVMMIIIFVCCGLTSTFNSGR